MKHTLIQALVALAAGATAAGQVGSLRPSSPTAGSEVRIVYAAEHEEATLPSNEQAFASVRLTTSSGFLDRAIPLQASTEGEWVAALAIPDDAVYLDVVFTTRSATDGRATLRSMIFDSNGDPVRRARVLEAWNQRAQCLEILEEELQAHPDSYSALRRKWMYLNFFGSERPTAEAIRQDLDRIEGIQHPEALMASAFLLKLSGESDGARDAVLSALRQHPTSWATAQAVRDLRARDAGMMAAIQKVVAQHPESWLARQSLTSDFGHLPFEVVKDVAASWSRDEPLNPLPHLYLATSSSIRDRELEQGRAAARMAVNRLLDGSSRIASAESRGLDEVHLPWSWIVSAELAEKAEDWAAAIGYAKTYSSYPEASPAGYELEARVWDRLHNNERARESWLRALALGSSKAKQELAQRWTPAETTEGGFETWLAVELAKLSSPTQRERAPEFQWKDMNGEAIDSAALQGRVVVLNFWSLGCSPCLAEVPQLNELVASYREEPVEFIALSPDGRAEVSEYLAKQPFDYRQVLGGQDLRKDLGLSALPGHVVLDGNRRTVAKFTGATPGYPHRLAGLIDLALAELRG